MSADLTIWLAEVPWVPLGVAVVAAAGFLFLSMGGKKKKATLAAKLAEGALVIDVRTPGEFSSGHYSGAINIPVDSLAAKVKKLGATDGAMVVCCASGARSARAAGILRSAGFTDVTDAGPWSNLEGATGR